MSDKGVKGPLITAVGLVAFIVIMGGLMAIAGQAMNRSLPVSDGGSSSGSSKTDGKGLDVHTARPTISLNQSADDGIFRFVVTAFSCGQTYLQAIS
jgi:hypothetical protein